MYEKSYLFLYQYMKRDRSKDLPLKNISYVKSDFFFFAFADYYITACKK